MGRFKAERAAEGVASYWLEAGGRQGSESEPRAEKEGV